MKYLKVFFITSILGFFITSLPGCNYVAVRAYDSGPGGPPPHAPAHGYRQKYHGYDLEFDTDLGAYIVLGITGVYFIDGMYYRYSNIGWHYSERPDGDWHTYNKRNPPGKLYKIRDDKNKWYRDKDKRDRENDRDRDKDRGRDRDRDRDRD